MGKRTILVDDLDGSEGAETVRFSLGSEFFQVDLSSANAKKLRQVLDPYVRAGRSAHRVASTPTAARAAARRSRDDGTKAVRAWAAENGIQLSSRGRIPQTVREQYQAAQTA